MGSKVYWNCLIGSMAEQISPLRMTVEFKFVEIKQKVPGAGCQFADNPHRALC